MDADDRQYRIDRLTKSTAGYSRKELERMSDRVLRDTYEAYECELEED